MKPGRLEEVTDVMLPHTPGDGAKKGIERASPRRL